MGKEQGVPKPVRQLCLRCRGARQAYDFRTEQGTE